MLFSLATGVIENVIIKNSDFDIALWMRYEDKYFVEKMSISFEIK